MGTKKLLIAAGVLAVLSGLLWYSNKNPEWGKEKKAESESPTLVTVPDASIQAIDIQKRDGTKVSLARKDGKWTITAPTAYPADQDAASGIVSALATVTGDSVVEQKPTDGGGLGNPVLSVTIHQKSKTERLMIGDDVPASSDVYAQVGGNPKFYAVPSSVKTSFDKGLNDLRDKRLLTIDQSKLTRVALANMEFGKNGQSEWAIIQPAPYRADNFQVEELLRKLSDAKMDLSLSEADAAKAQKAFAGGKVVANVKLTDSNGTQTLEVRKSGEDYYGKSSVVPNAHKLAADLGKQVEKPLDEFRNKKLFDFGYADPTKIEIQGRSFLRSGSDWKAEGKVVDSAGVQGVVDKLRELSAAKFEVVGFLMPAATITVVSNDGKRTEKVEFSKSADGYLARRGAEPGLYQIDAKSVDDILDASTKVKAAASSKK